MMNLTEIRTKIEKQKRSIIRPIDLATGAFLNEIDEPLKDELNCLKIENFDYTTSIGGYQVRQSLAELFSRQHDVQIMADNVALVFGATEGVFLAIATNDHVKNWVHFFPGWHTFSHMLRTLKLELQPIYIEGDNFFQNDLIERLKNNDQGFFINTPVNPTGWLIPLQTMLNIIKQPRVHSLLDMTYYGMAPFDSKDYFNEVVRASVQNLDTSCLVFSLSKLFGLPGLRLGFIISNASHIEKIANLKSATSLNLPLDFQSLLVKLWSKKDNQIETVRHYLLERDIWLANECQIRGINYSPGLGTHYRIINFGKYFDEIIEHLINQNIFVAPCIEMGLPTAIRYNISTQKSHIRAFLDQLLFYQEKIENFF